MKPTTHDHHASLAIIDTREWQNRFDLRTGDKSGEQGPLVEMMQQVLSRHHYPGDLHADSNRWVTDIALDLAAGYQPRFTFLTYAQQYFASRVGPMDVAERRRMMAELFREVERFLGESGCMPVIVGRGGVTSLNGIIDLSMLDGIGISTHWSARYAGLHEPSGADLKRLREEPGLDRIVTRSEFLELFDGSPGDGRLLPDYLLVARRGYAFRALGCTMRKPVMIPDAADHIPLSSPLGTAADITAIRGLVERGLQQGHRVALIVLEGVGSDDFLLPFTPCGNNRAWFCYEPGDAQFLAITTGQHRIFDYPPGYLFHDEDTREKEYPLSGYFKKIPAGTIGAEFSGRSIAVGNKSMAMHMVAGADLCVECFARNYYNQGTLGVIHRQDKP
ncbi:hypothetical protein FO488_12915 [Geobacter sp. FeAm09]|uniref:hypothetical protein n=1 Tax=Geobacter sp. FeAm09 TaxID=2597769 RepID=UPI0011EEC3D6|nr:hypothetical protein [Geobacter sp. FeAm09]QEM68968.1 hypothetical protein FO488_12915 [Geobacter sp. FeAm09]